MGRLERKLDDDVMARVRAGIKPKVEKKEQREHNPRAAMTYRANRRNECLRGDPPSTWGPDWHYEV
jgi:hypothetical protein